MTVRGSVRMNEDDAFEMDIGGDELNEGVEVCIFISGMLRYFVYVLFNLVFLIINEDSETRFYEVCFDDVDVDEVTF